MRYRIVRDVGKWKKGAVVETGRSALRAMADQVGLKPHEMAIPEEMGTHYSEREPIEILPLDDAREPIPAGEMPDVDQKEAEKRFLHCEQTLSPINS